MPFSKISFLLALLLLTAAGPGYPADASKLKAAWADAEAVRSVFFIEGMSCRACTIMLHRKINGAEGVYWARFNFPLRLLTVYHSPKAFPASAVTAMMDGSSELKASLLAHKPAASFKPGRKPALASWKGGRVDLSETGPVLKPFERYLTDEMGETDERTQVCHEILGENARNRLLAAIAIKEGVGAGASVKEFPRPVLKDFYWRDNTAPSTPDERALAAYVSKKTSDGSPKDEMRLFDNLLKKLYAETVFEFTGEYAEIRK